MIFVLQLDFKPSLQKNFANDLKEKVTEVQESSVEKIAGKTVTLMQDWWSSAHNDSVIANSYFMFEKVSLPKIVGKK